MFPRLRETLGTALDLVVEFSTLGEYRLDATGAPAPASALAAALEPTPQRGGTGSVAGVAAERFVAGSAAASRSPRAPAATPAARRLQGGPPRPALGSGTNRPCHGARGHGGRERIGSGANRDRAGTGIEREHAASGSRRARFGAPAVPEQLCFAGV